MELQKVAKINLEEEPYLKPISDRGIGFYNLDKNTAQFQFIVSKNDKPLLISEQNVKGYAFFKGKPVDNERPSTSGVLDVEFIDPMRGLIGVTVPQWFLKNVTNSTVLGEVYLSLNDAKLEGKDDTVVLGTFSFSVRDSLVNQIESDIKVSYIRMFDDLRETIEKKVEQVQKDLGDLNSLIELIKQTANEAVEKINLSQKQTLDELKSVKTEARTDIDNARDDALRQISAKRDDVDANYELVKTSFQEVVKQSTTDFDSHATDANTTIDEKVSDFKKTLEADGFVKPEALDSKLSDLSWQKYKLTSDDGNMAIVEQFDFNDLDNALAKTPHMYFGISEAKNVPNDLLNAGVMTNIGVGNYRLLTYYPHSNPDKFITNVKWGGVWKGWKQNIVPTDTGWVEFNLLNGAKANTAFNSDGEETGFKCSYRKVTNGSVTTNYLRLNGSNVTSGQIIAQLPNTFTKYSQSFPVRVPVSTVFAGGYITIRPSGEVRFYVNGDTSGWRTTSYFYGETNWSD
ncbi:BppU family phage baseplate upper protein [Staphylococcus ratti]|uniref:BppU family phage baseplate upper protein n=1 Tax=Staphylococcus ratti TaxID=2892440 RepID=A0ABY3PBP0_9STAP|nr:BppU family phage baseplate upper protein [Staphylococcus ratti]UEX89683.1 BppU family phage baseplate upper protein [Staphylococcus ratti]